MAESNYLTDFIKVQQNLPTVHKDGKGNYGKYMKLEDIMPKVLEVLNKHNFALIQLPSVNKQGNPTLITSLVHTSGERIEAEMLLMLDRQTAQGQGSGITYARRYAVCSMLGLVADEDDDGQKATDESTRVGAVKFGSQARPKDPNAPLTPAQVGLVFARLKSKGITSKDEANNAIFLITGKDKISEVTMGEMDDLLNGIDQMEATEPF